MIDDDQAESEHDRPALTRRRFLVGGAMVAGAGIVAACSSTSSSSSSPSSSPSTTVPGTTAQTATTTIPTTTTPLPTAPATSGETATVPPSTEAAAVETTDIAAPAASLDDVEHIVILIQENRSFDQYFGTRKGVAGFASAPGEPYSSTYPDHPDGKLLPFHFDSATTSGPCGPDPNHSWEAQHAAWNNGKNDGFATAMGPHALGYFRRADLPYYWALADEFTLCDHYFCSVLGPTNPNRHMAMTGTIDPAGAGGGPAIDNSGTSYTWETYPERLQAAGVSWRVYHEVDDFDDNNLKFFTQFRGLAPGNPLYDNALVNLAANAFVTDAAAGKLPQVSWLVAPTAISEHPSFAPSVGEHFTASKIAAVMANPALWAKTVFILTYDENGGFFDHVSPPTPPAGTKDEFVNGEPIGLGFRVPTIVVSPWTRRAAAESGTGADGARVNNAVFDHTSLLRLLETKFGVQAPLISDWRRATCGDLADVLDFTTFDTSVPQLPDTAQRAAQFAGGCGSLPAAAPPAAQTPAAVES